MIFIDSSETRSTSKMPHIESAIKTDGLEFYTGADFMISRLQMPATTEMLIGKHIKNGALLVQRKHGMDLASSISERLNHSLAKMHEAGAKQSQCILLFIGMLFADKDGNALIDKRRTVQKFWTIQASISKWHDRGGVYESIPRANMIERWCKMKLNHLDEYAVTRIKEVWATRQEVTRFDDFLQVPVAVDDGRNLLVTLPGIGPKAANALFEEFDGDIASILCWLTYPPKEGNKQKIKGIGPKTIENVREYLGVDEHMWLSQEVFARLQ